MRLLECRKSNRERGQSARSYSLLLGNRGAFPPSVFLRHSECLCWCALSARCIAADENISKTRLFSFGSSIFIRVRSGDSSHFQPLNSRLQLSGSIVFPRTKLGSLGNSIALAQVAMTTRVAAKWMPENQMSAALAWVGHDSHLGLLYSAGNAPLGYSSLVGQALKSQKSIT